MSDTNHHILTGKVDVTSNLLVGSSHLFVDTNNNRVGLITTDPHAGLHVNSNAYVHADLRVGSQIEINATAGRIKADKFEGDGSLLVNAPVGSLAVHSTDTGVAGSDALVSNEGTPTAANFKFTIPRGDTGAQGIQGNTGTTAIGSVTTGNPGSQATVVNSGTSTDATLDFTIPRGDVGAQGIQGVQGVQGIQGIQGNTGTVAVHSTDTGVAGSQASVSNEGTSTVADFKFTIPRGDTGDQGIQGIQGVQGPAATIAVSTPTTTGAAGTNASVTNSGSSSAATFNFTIPRGDTGAQGIQGVQGPAATVAVGTTTTGAAGTNASVTNAGSSSAATFNFIIPQGADGSDGADGTNYFTLSGSDIYRSTGNVGIGGTASATNRLKVDGTVEATTFTGSLSTSVTPGSYLTGSAYNGSTARTFTVDATTAATASKIVARDGSGDIFGRYMNMSHGATARNSDTVFYSSTDNYIRKTTAAGMRSSLGVAALAGSTTQAFSVSTLTTTGNVGIGTDSPDGKLHIYETTGTSHGLNVGTLILEHGNSGGSSSIVFPSKVNITSDYGYITYNENYGEAGISSTENGVLLLGAENDGTGSSDHVRIKTRLVVEADVASTDPTYAFQVKSSNTTSDLFAVHRGGSIGINGIDQAVPFTINSNKTATINGTTFTTYCKWYRGSGNWWIGSDNATNWNQNLYWFSNTNETGNPLKLVIMFENDQSKGTNLNINTFTGQHRNIVRGVNPTNIETFIGLIVSADNNENIKVNGGVERGLDAITINETIPLVSVTNKAYDKSVFGVVSGSEDPEYREDKFGRVTSVFIKEEGDDRIFINSLGEGAMWISNQNGPLTSGDYVTSSHIPGYGMKQDSEFLANYTVAKITMNCDFQVTPRIKYKIKSEFKTVNYYRHEDNFIKEPEYTKLDADVQAVYTREQYDENVNILDEHGQLQWEDSGETEAPYKLRYLLPDGTQISEEEYTTRALANEEVYLAAFVGCTYHCG